MPTALTARLKSCSVTACSPALRLCFVNLFLLILLPFLCFLRRSVREPSGEARQGTLCRPSGFGLGRWGGVGGLKPRRAVKCSGDLAVAYVRRVWRGGRCSRTLVA